mgnify:FL=1
MRPNEWPPLPDKIAVLVNAFTYDKRVGAAVFSYCCGLGPQMANHPRLDRLVISYTHGYPTDRCRNAASAQAKKDGFHFLLMLDDDQVPDLLLGKDPAAKPFFPTALDFALSQPGPILIGAPYCGGPPAQDVMVMKNREYCPDQPGGAGYKMDRHTRDEAAVKTGVEKVAALPTGCLLVDLRVLDALPPPWFSYEYGDAPYNTSLASTEDVVFTRNAHWIGVPQYVTWDCWAGHDKRYVTGKPRLAPVDEVPAAIYQAWSAGWRPANTH